MPWDQRFDDPIMLPGGKPLVTLRDAALYITKLPKAEHDAEEWQTAMEALLLVAESDGPTMFARIGVMRAPLPTRLFCRTEKSANCHSFVEIVVIAPRRHRGRTLQELRRVMARFARSRALGRIAADLGL